MDDSKLRLRRTPVACEEGTAGIHGSTSTHDFERSRSFDSQSTLMNMFRRRSNNNNNNKSNNSNSKIQRGWTKRRRWRKRDAILCSGRWCKLCMGGMAAAIVSATLSVSLLPFAWTQVDYHHQFQHEVQYVYQKLHDNRQNYHSVVDNYHPNGMSRMHNHHHHISNEDKHDTNEHLNSNANSNANAWGPSNNRNGGHKFTTRKDRILQMDDFTTRKHLRRPKPEDDDTRPDHHDARLDPSPPYLDPHQPPPPPQIHTHEQEQEHEQKQPAPSVAIAIGPPPPKPEIVTCGDGTVGFLNDDYCDCPLDGSDEPDTSACSGVLVETPKFECGRRGGGGGVLAALRDTLKLKKKDHNYNHSYNNKNNKNHNQKDTNQPKWIYASRVNDGIVDCPDGSDEYGHVLDELETGVQARHTP